jgi:hypothetical protein
MRGWRSVSLALILTTSFSTISFADEPAAQSDSSMLDKGMAMFDSGKLLATGGVSNVEGAGGGGLATWALISGYGTRDGLGLNGHFTYINTDDYAMWTEGVAIGLFDRVELSYARQTFDTQKIGGALGLGDGFKIDQDIWGAKVKIFGDAVYDQDSWIPQIAAGAQYKHNHRGFLVNLLGAKSDGVDYYVSATKLFLAESLLVDATWRETKANEFGLLGFGGGKHDDYSAQFEGSAAYLFTRKFAVGAEFRTKPDNLGVREQDSWDVFAAYFFTKNISLTAAYVDLGNVLVGDQRGEYVSLQIGL